MREVVNILMANLFALQAAGAMAEPPRRPKDSGGNLPLSKKIVTPPPPAKPQVQNPKVLPQKADTPTPPKQLKSDKVTPDLKPSSGTNPNELIKEKSKEVKKEDLTPKPEPTDSAKKDTLPKKNSKEVASKSTSMENCSSLSSSRRAQCLRKHELAMLGGGALYDIPGYGGAYSYRLKSGSELGIEGLKNSQNLIKDRQKESLYYDYIAIKYIQIGLFWRRALFNFDSLFFKTAIAFRRSEVGMSGSKSTNYGDLDFSIGTKSETALLSASIANRYTFQNGFTLGLDWVGIAVPIKSKHTEHSEYNGDPDPELKKTSEKVTSVFKKPIPMVMLLSIGWRI